jgi:hypothetical protein
LPDALFKYAKLLAEKEHTPNGSQRKILFKSAEQNKKAGSPKGRSSITLGIMPAGKYWDIFSGFLSQY